MPVAGAPASERPAPQPEPNGQSPDKGSPTSQSAVGEAQLDVKRLIDHAALFVAPTTLITALMYWLGWSRTHAYWAYFGIDQALLKYSTTDYLIRAVNTAFTFLTMLFLFAITVIMLYRTAERQRHRLQPFQLQLLEWGLLGTGVLFFSRVALADLFPSQLGGLDWARWASRGRLVGPIFGIIGLLLVAYSAQLHASRLEMLHKSESLYLRRSRRLLNGLAGGLVVLATFLAADRYADFKGTELAMVHAAYADASHEAVIYANRRLQITGTGLTEVPLDAAQNPEPQFRFQYVGLRLLKYSRGNYFFLALGERRTVVLRESPDLRVEFVHP